ncbi:ABC transporter permease [Amycolatopsis aidingensis]|uniref:ABC transporter permease n=1 Tax=Amycolatopsis aidingensis TaxID=2842453 RepID=UPI001C0C498F|nr:ABC transporter permease [Amycolatopsis aidingensis]
MLRWSLLTWARADLSLRKVLPLLAGLAALLALCAGLASGASAAVERDVLRSGGLTHIELWSFDDGSSVRPLNSESLGEATEIPEVETITADYVASIQTPSGQDGLPAFSFSTHTLGVEDDLPVVAGSQPDSLGPDQVLLPASSQGIDFTPYVGTELPVEYTKATGPNTGTGEAMTLKVVGVFDPSWQTDGPDTAYLSEDTAAALAAARAGQPVDTYRRTEGAVSAVVQVDHERNVRAVTAELQAMDFSAAPVADRVRNLPGLFGAADVISRWALVLFAGLSAFVGLARAKDSVRARLSHFAILRVLGSGVGDLRKVLLGEGALTAAIAGVAGTVTGLVAAMALSGPSSDLLGLTISVTDVIPHPLWLLLALVVPAGGLLTGIWLGGRYALRADPYLVVRRHT